MPAVSLPNGCRSLPAEVLALLEWFDKVRLWMDNDGSGMKGAEKFVRNLGLERCLVEGPSRMPGWNGGGKGNPPFEEGAGLGATGDGADRVAGKTGDTVDNTIMGEA